MRKIYIAGPMSNLPALNFPAFNAEAARLRALGYNVINPAELNVGADDLQPFDQKTPEEKHAHWCRCMKADIAAMLTCDTVALLPGWNGSKGALLEVEIAEQLGIWPRMASNIVEMCEHLTPDQAIVLRARHWATTSEDLRAAHADSQAEALQAHQFAADLLRGAVAAAEGGAA